MNVYGMRVNVGVKFANQKILLTFKDNFIENTYCKKVLNCCRFTVPYATTTKLCWQPRVVAMIMRPDGTWAQCSMHRPFIVHVSDCQ